MAIEFFRCQVAERTHVHSRAVMGAGVRLTQLEAWDVDTLSAAEVTAALRDVALIRGTTDRLEAALARRVAELHADGQAAPPADVLGRQGRTSRRAAEQAERRADALGHAPKLNDALGKGKVGAEHADAVANAAGRLDDDQRAALFEKDQEIVELAASHSPEVFRRRLGKLVDDITNDDGLEYAGLRRDQLMARALDRLACGTRSTKGMGPAEVAVLLDYQTLTSGRHDGSVCEYSDGTAIPVETARRHACDANIIPVVLGGDSQPLDVGRASRLATPAQRTALRAMYRTCAIVGCDRHFDECHVHHLAEWDDFGLSDMDNLIPVCSFHHHRVHEGRWQLQLDASTRQLTVTLPDGSYHSRSLPDLLAERNAA